MTETPNTTPPVVYEIRVKGHLDRRWTDWFGGLTVTLEEGGVTQLKGPVSDQPALHALLRHVRDVGLTLVSVTRVKADSPEKDQLGTGC